MTDENKSFNMHKWAIKYDNANNVLADICKEFEEHQDKTVRVGVQTFYSLLHYQRALVTQLQGELFKHL